jgi:hypothetical protein
MSPSNSLPNGKEFLICAHFITRRPKDANQELSLEKHDLQ